MDGLYELFLFARHQCFYWGQLVEQNAYEVYRDVTMNHQQFFHSGARLCAEFLCTSVYILLVFRLSLWLGRREKEQRRLSSAMLPKGTFLPGEDTTAASMSSRSPLSLVEWLFGLAFSACLLAQVIFKARRSPRHLAYMFQPCHILSFVILLCLALPRRHMRPVWQTVRYMICMYASIALFAPDHSLQGQFLEVPIFYIQHWLLILYPIYEAFKQRFGSPRNGDWSWYLWAHAVNTAIHIWLFLPMSTFLGPNVNYMSAPPPTAPRWLKGDLYRPAGFLLLYLPLSWLFGRIVLPWIAAVQDFALDRWKRLRASTSEQKSD